MEAINLVCFKCKHFRRFEGGCDAFRCCRCLLQINKNDNDADDRRSHDEAAAAVVEKRGFEW